MMVAGISTPFRIATEAVRRCAHLHRETAGLGAAATAARALKTAGSQFPSSVLGGELLDVMSTQFRDRLDQSNGRTVTTYGHEALRTFAAPTKSQRTGNSWAENVRENSASATFKPAGPGSAPTFFPPSGAPLPSMGDTTRATATTRDSSRSSPWETLSSAEALPQSLPGPPSPAGKSARAEPISLIARKLEEYWDLERRAATARASAMLAADLRSASKGPPTEPSAMASSTAPPAGLHRVQSTFAQRLQSFVSREPQDPPDPSWRDREASASDTPRLRTDLEATPGGVFPPDFAERLAETLRGQAIQHGIDLT
jgi:hypothetical protein